jgi:hypothetical protein
MPPTLSLAHTTLQLAKSAKVNHHKPFTKVKVRIGRKTRTYEASSYYIFLNEDNMVATILLSYLPMEEFSRKVQNGTYWNYCSVVLDANSGSVELTPIFSSHAGEVK